LVVFQKFVNEEMERKWNVQKVKKYHRFFCTLLPWIVV